MSDSTETLVRSLHTRKNRERRDLTLAEGVRLVEEVLAAGVPVKAAVVSPALESTPRGAALLAALATKTPRLDRVEDRALAGLASTDHPQGVIAVIEPKAWRIDEVAPPHSAPLTARRVVLVLDGVQDPGNVGTAIRTAWALGATGVVALPGTAELTNPKVLRGAMGATFRLPCAASSPDEFFAWLADRKGEVWAATPDGADISTLDSRLSTLVAVAVGNEGAGLSPAVAAAAARKVSIPMRPGAESLNVGVAAGILLHELLHDR
jgi:TrmH family RNA methyltransferase